ncbi:MAG TPA: hypothetical protein DEA08_19220 [Planctomycetes bacterium]|nr:hypothetical protein [Planctomycetota bacterium]
MATILVIDDDAQARDLFTQVLGVEHEVTTASDWVTANAALRPGVDLVLIDVNMPTLSGDTVTKILLQTKPNLQIVLTSAMDESELRRLARSVGAAGAIPKTFDQLLRVRVRRYLP